MADDAESARYVVKPLHLFEAPACVWFFRSSYLQHSGMRKATATDRKATSKHSTKGAHVSLAFNFESEPVLWHREHLTCANDFKVRAFRGGSPCLASAGCLDPTAQAPQSSEAL